MDDVGVHVCSASARSIRPTLHVCITHMELTRLARLMVTVIMAVTILICTALHHFHVHRACRTCWCTSTAWRQGNTRRGAASNRSSGIGCATWGALAAVSVQGRGAGCKAVRGRYQEHHRSHLLFEAVVGRACESRIPMWTYHSNHIQGNDRRIRAQGRVRNGTQPSVVLPGAHAAWLHATPASLACHCLPSLCTNDR